MSGNGELNETTFGDIAGGVHLRSHRNKHTTSEANSPKSHYKSYNNSRFNKRQIWKDKCSHLTTCMRAHDPCRAPSLPQKKRSSVFFDAVCIKLILGGSKGMEAIMLHCYHSHLGGSLAVSQSTSQFSFLSMSHLANVSSIDYLRS